MARQKLLFTSGNHDGWGTGNLSPVSGSVHRVLGAALAVLGNVWVAATPATSSEFSEPWKREDRALVIDAYEYNSIDWHKLVEDKRIVGFINKASDGLAPDYYCRGAEKEFRLCKALWKRHAVARELFQTRRTVAKALGLEWGAYHLGRPGNPVDQANNFLDFAQPAPDDLIALDIEDNDPEEWMSLDEAEDFVRQIRRRTGRYPILYTNDNTASHIAANRHRYRLLSRLPLWYARYKPEIGSHFPKGHWQSYALWQFVARANCDQRSCPYRPPGTPLDIDVNVAAMTPDALRAAWPFGELLGTQADMMASVPVPYPRHAALASDEVVLQFAQVEKAPGPSAAEPSAFDALLSAGKQPIASSMLGFAPASPRPAGDDPLAPFEKVDARLADDRGGGLSDAVVQPTGDVAAEAARLRSRVEQVERRHQVAEAIERGFADAVVTRSVVRAPQPAEAQAFARSAMPVFLLGGPAVQLDASFLLPASETRFLAAE
jgi:GH25 family lysozyme M1 (1,4-beta-N-acetylmuramidase)